MLVAALLAGLAVLTLGFSMDVDAKAHNQSPLRLYIGGYDGTIRSFDYDVTNRNVTPITALNITGSSPSWLLFRRSLLSHRALDKIYAVDEADPGHVFAINVDNRSGNLTLQQTADTDAGPVALTTAGGPFRSACLFTADYTAGNVTVHALAADGSIRDPNPVKTFSFNGSGPVTSRQDHSYAHQVVTDPSGRFVYVPDLGGDQVHVLSVPPSAFFDCSQVTLAPSIDVAKGSGPRHIAFYKSKTHPHTTYAYLTSELTDTLTAFKQDPSGKLEQIGEPVRVLPPGTAYPGYSVDGPNASEVGITQDGNFVFAGTRGSPDSIDHVAVFRRSQTNGSLTWVDWYPTEGKTVRHFSITQDPASSLVVAANQDSDSAIIFSRNATTGALTKQTVLTGLGRPAFAQFV